MADTDRTIYKKARAGALGTMGASTSAIAEANKLDEETFRFPVLADADQVERGFYVRKKCIIKSVEFTPTTALAAHATAYITVTVAKRDGAGGSAATIATFDTATGGSNVSLAAFVPYSLTLSATAANLQVAAGNVITFKCLESSTPVTPLSDCTITVEYV